MLAFVLSSAATVLTPSALPLKGVKATKVNHIVAKQIASGKLTPKDQCFKYHRSASLIADILGAQSARNIKTDFPLEADIDIEVDNIQATTVHFTLTPGNFDEFYCFTVLDKLSFDAMTDAQVQDYCKADIEHQMDIFAQFGIPSSYADFCYTQRAISGTYTDLEPNTDYVVAAYYMDGETGEPLSALNTASFKTAEDIVQPVTDTLTVHIVDPEWTDYVEEEGWWQIRGYSADEAYYVTLSNLYSDVVPGVYAMDDMDLDYSYLYLVNEDQQVEFNTLDVIVTLEENILNVKAEADSKNGVHYIITFETIDLSKPRGNQYDFTEDDVEGDYTIEETNILLDEEEGYAYIRCEREGELLAMLIYIDGAELATGTYGVNDAYEPGSVQPCQVGPNGVYPSFWANTMEDGSLIVPFFFFAGGTVEVSYDAAGNLVLMADVQNTWLRTGRFTINASADAIKSVGAGKSATVIKTIEDGNIVIKKNGRRYNVMGIQY